jgi:predicted nucleotidyltransferase
MINHVNQILEEIKTKFISTGIDKLVLFGSFAYGVPREDSDIDLLVVTSDDRIPQSFSEKSTLDVRYNRLIDHIKAHVPIDLIVQTRGMHQKFVEKNSLFGRELLTKGKVLYERSH